MWKKLVTLLFVLLVIIGQTCGQNLDKSISVQANWSMAEDPLQSRECFASYLPKINEATNTYELEYTKCLQTAEAARETMDSEVASDQTDIYYEAEGVCNLLQECSEKQSSFDFFKCHYEAAGQALSDLYALQILSKNGIQYINMKLQMISHDESVCTDACSDSYIRESTSLYAALEACLAGKGFPSESASTTMGTTATGTTTTETTTTEMSTTETSTTEMSTTDTDTTEMSTADTTTTETTTTEMTTTVTDETTLTTTEETTSMPLPTEDTTTVTETTSTAPPVPPTFNPPSTAATIPTPTGQPQETTTSTLAPPTAPTPPTVNPPSTAATSPTPPNANWK